MCLRLPPVDHFVKKFTKKFWAKNKASVQKKMEAKFNEMMSVHLSKNFPSFLTGFGGLNLDLPDTSFFRLLHLSMLLCFVHLFDKHWSLLAVFACRFYYYSKEEISV